MNPKVIVHPNGNKEWFLGGERHREDGPAIIYSSGAWAWWLYNHRFATQKKWFSEVLKLKLELAAINNSVGKIMDARFNIESASFGYYTYDAVSNYTFKSAEKISLFKDTFETGSLYTIVCRLDNISISFDSNEGFDELLSEALKVKKLMVAYYGASNEAKTNHLPWRSQGMEA